MAVVALVTATHSAAVPVQRRWAEWAACPVFVASKAAAPVAFQAASDGSKVVWTTVLTYNPAAWDITLVTHLTVARFTRDPHRLK